MLYIALIAVIGILLLQWTGSIPLASVGGSMTIGFAFIAAALAAGIHEAWTMRRGVLGWIVNIVVSFLGAFLAAQLGGMVIVMLVMLVGSLVDLNLKGSLMASGEPVASIALAGGMVATLLGSWGALQIVNRWR